MVHPEIGTLLEPADLGDIFTELLLLEIEDRLEGRCSELSNERLALGCRIEGSFKIPLRYGLGVELGLVGKKKNNSEAGEKPPGRKKHVSTPPGHGRAAGSAACRNISL